ncbi:MAG: hypothetical protein Q4E09_04605 [Eubacteriales bacterium]|nr:hypothetical protein [Eubacteriales bacterium]
MKEKRTLIREFINQILILLALGIAVVWLLANRAALGNLGRLSFLRHFVWILPLLYILLLLESIRGFSANYLFKRYDPADTASLADLKAIRRYQFFSPREYPLEGDAAVHGLLAGLFRSGYREVSRESFGVVLERGNGKEASRIAVIYKPMLNFLIAERHINEASEYVLQAQRRIPHNAIVLVSDMDSDEEMLSSGVAVVNFASKLQKGLILMPYLLDVKHGRLFYPQDSSGLSLGDRSYYSQQREDMSKAVLRASKQAPERSSR